MATSSITRLLRAFVVSVLALGLGFIVPAYASITTKTDPSNDVFLGTVGAGIDLSAVRLATLNRKKRIQITFSLHKSVPNESLEQPGGLRVEFIKNERTRRVVKIATDDGVLRGEVCSSSRAPKFTESYDCSPLAVAQLDATTYRALIKRKQVKEGATLLKWTASSIDLRSGDPVSDQLTTRKGEPFRWRL